LSIANSSFLHTDTGSKPFKCGICDRGFSRGDVLNRHVKGHKHTTSVQAPIREHASVLEPSGIATGSVQTHHIFEEDRPAVTPRPQHFGSVNTMFWSGEDTNPSVNQDTQPDLSSSLLWPDSENLFQSLTDGVIWDQTMPGMIPLDHLPHQVPQATGTPPAAVGLSPYDEPTVTEDGRRAVQTTNGLLTNTVRGVGLPVVWVGERR
jgi:hypothetical protein